MISTFFAQRDEILVFKNEIDNTQCIEMIPSGRTNLDTVTYIVYHKGIFDVYDKNGNKRFQRNAGDSNLTSAWVAEDGETFFAETENEKAIAFCINHRQRIKLYPIEHHLNLNESITTTKSVSFLVTGKVEIDGVEIASPNLIDGIGKTLVAKENCFITEII